MSTVDTRRGGAVDAAVRLEGVSVVRSGRTLLRDLSLTVPVGATFAVIGANGAGKTTLLRLLEGYEFPTRGTVTVLGETLGQTDVARLRHRVRLVGSAGVSDVGGEAWARDFPATMPLETVVSTGPTGTLVRYDPLTPAESRTARSALAAVGLRGRESVLWQHASAGERTRTLLARATSTVPGESSGGVLLLLDEPTAALDPGARESVVAALASPPPGVTQIIVTHHIEELPPTTTHALVLHHGRPLAQGPVRKVLTSAILSKAFAHPLKVTHRKGRYTLTAD